MVDIAEIAEKFGLNTNDLQQYGRYIAKVGVRVSDLSDRVDGKLVLVSSINPTPAGEGKTTVSIGLVDALNLIEKSAVLSLREPSMGPVFGMKGGATGAGKAAIEPSDDINLHFTGDFHALTAANNLLCALVDNHMQQGNSLKINPKTIMVKRCVDINDRVLRNVVVGLGSKACGITREEHFNITAASELMAALCLCDGISDLKNKISKILVGFSFDERPIFVSDLQVQGAIAAVLKYAVWPNLVQTLGGSPVLVHGGPFANIAHGCCSLMATRLALKLGQYAVTEAGFGSDLGAEKFFNIKCRLAGLRPSCVVLVVTLRALKFHGGASFEKAGLKDVEVLKKGLCNLQQHIENIRRFGPGVVVALNKFLNDSEEEIAVVESFCRLFDCYLEVCSVFEQGGLGAIDLAHRVVELCSKPSNFKFSYDDSDSFEQKAFKICTQVYGAKSVSYSKNVVNKLKKFEQIGFGRLPVCICKTPYSLSTDASLVGRPQGFSVDFDDASLSAGAGFVVMLTGSVLVMPGYGKTPAAMNVDVDDDGKIFGIS